MFTVTVNPTATETPDSIIGGVAVTGMSTTGHSTTTSNANANASPPFGSDSNSQTKSARWFTFSVPQGGDIVAMNLKFSWTIVGNASANDGGGGGSANATASVFIEYSVNGGGAWTTAVSDSFFAFAPGGGGGGFSSGGSSDISIPTSYPQGTVSQVMVRDSIFAGANASAGFDLGADSIADASITISSIRLEVLMQDSRVIFVG